ncbi:hypothetical protein PR048_024260 [Dryococelus australis]|uniref:YqaJ viral recombinase domain-containing protein n=1 Tax=Dryococelus australis TaxID=614101 RepID=A0ABQ9GN69_9NEOP|nr:hypothetical protein PR048_024260 [Dryococelus australis]
MPEWVPNEDNGQFLPRSFICRISDNFHNNLVVNDTVQGVRNKYCTVCARSPATDAKNTVASHKCAKNWSGSSASMEQNVIVEVIFLSIGMHGLVYCHLIADGDCSVHGKLMDAMSYWTTQCARKANRCYVLLDNSVHGKLIDAMSYWTTRHVEKIEKKQSEDKYYLSIEELRKDILNSPFYILGNHSEFSETHYLCDGLPKPGEDNLVEMLHRIIHKSSVNKKAGKLRRRRLIFHGRNRVEHRNKKNFNSDYGPNASLSTPDMSQSTTNWGIEKESVAIAQFERDNRGIVVQISGLFVEEEYPFLGASLDGLIGDDQIIKVKCPSSAISMPPLDAHAKGKIKYLEMKDGMPQLKLSHNYMYQVQGVLHISWQKTCNFVVWSPEGMVFLKIQRDKDFWENKMVTKLLTFFYDSPLPEIIYPRRPRNMPIRELPHIKSAQEAKRWKKKSENRAPVETTKIICEESYVM